MKVNNLVLRLVVNNDCYVIGDDFYLVKGDDFIFFVFLWCIVKEGFW